MGGVTRFAGAGKLYPDDTAAVSMCFLRPSMRQLCASCSRYAQNMSDIATE